jgi:predicted MFS family arabinose efflux permease
MSQGKAIAVFAAFAAAYFVSALLRAVTATLAPALIQEFNLNAQELGLLAGAYFLGFSAIQLPLGGWLDHWGPKRVVLVLLSIAVLGCWAFAEANSFATLLAARALCGVGVSACLMAALTGYRRWFAPVNQIRANSWMLMIGSLGMVASTVPVQWLLPQLGWRPLFIGLACMVLISMVMIGWQVPRWQAMHLTPSNVKLSYAEVFKNPYFQSLVPLGFFNFGGLLAIQTLWAAPWMVKVALYTPLQAAAGLFWLNIAMLVSYWIWGLANPWLEHRGFTVNRMLTMGIPISILVVAILSIAGPALSTSAAAILTLYCVTASVGALAQPALGLEFRAELAGRALSAFNLVIFCGVFFVQWGMGLLIDGLQGLGWQEPMAYQGAMGIYGLSCVGGYSYFIYAKKRHNYSHLI